MQYNKLTFEGDDEGIALELDGEELAVCELLGDGLGLFDSANEDCTTTIH